MLYRHAAFLAALAAVFVLSAANVQATLIDYFDAGAQSLWTSQGTPYSLSQANVTSEDAIGGYRNVAIQWLTGRQSYVDVLADPTLAGLSFTEGTGEAIATVTWDGPDIPNILEYALNANLTSGGENQFVLDVEQVTGTGIQLTLTVYTDATHASQSTIFLDAQPSEPLALPYGTVGSVFSQLAGASGPADFAHVGAIVLELSGAGHPGSDITINSITTDTHGPVPEPSTLVLAAIGGLGLLGVRRRWRKT
jgi:hypothetical protein